VCVGTDGVIDYVPGTAAANPTKPALPGSHVRIGMYILVSGGATEITGADIGREYQAPSPGSVTVTPADADLSWSELSTTITVSVLDQYGNPIGLGGNGWYITLEFAAGNGTISSAEEGSSTAKIGLHTGANQSQGTFTYTRNQLATDESPVFEAVLEINYALYGFGKIILRDAAGDLM